MIHLAANELRSLPSIYLLEEHPWIQNAETGSNACLGEAVRRFHKFKQGALGVSFITSQRPSHPGTLDPPSETSSTEAQVMVEQLSGYPTVKNLNEGLQNNDPGAWVLVEAVSIIDDLVLFSLGSPSFLPSSSHNENHEAISSLFLLQ